MTNVTTIQIISPELEGRIAALTEEARSMLPAAADLARRAWETMQDYHDQLDPIFDRDQAAEVTGSDGLWAAINDLEGQFGAVTESADAAEPAWLIEAKAARGITFGQHTSDHSLMS